MNKSVLVLSVLSALLAFQGCSKKEEAQEATPVVQSGDNMASIGDDIGALAMGGQSGNPGVSLPSINSDKESYVPVYVGSPGFGIVAAAHLIYANPKIDDFSLAAALAPKEAQRVDKNNTFAKDDFVKSQAENISAARKQSPALKIKLYADPVYSAGVGVVGAYDINSKEYSVNVDLSRLESGGVGYSIKYPQDMVENRVIKVKVPEDIARAFESGKLGRKQFGYALYATVLGPGKGASDSGVSIKLDALEVFIDKDSGIARNNAGWGNNPQSSLIQSQFIDGPNI